MALYLSSLMGEGWVGVNGGRFLINFLRTRDTVTNTIRNGGKAEWFKASRLKRDSTGDPLKVRGEAEGPQGPSTRDVDSATPPKAGDAE